MCYTWASERPMSCPQSKRRCTECWTFHKYSSKANFQVALNVKERLVISLCFNERRGKKKAVRSFKGFYGTFVNYRMATFKRCRKKKNDTFVLVMYADRMKITKDWRGCVPYLLSPCVRVSSSQLLHTWRESRQTEMWVQVYGYSTSHDCLALS